MKSWAFILFLLLSQLSLKSQSQSKIPLYPTVGKPCPDFVLDDVQYYAKRRVSLRDFRGKWLIINCYNLVSLQESWGDTSAYLIGKEYLPYADSLQQRFKSKVQFLILNYTGSQYTRNSYPKGENEYIRSAYEEIRKDGDLQLPIAYDSTFFHRFDIGICPFVIAIDPNGIVRSITLPLQERDLVALLKGEAPLAKCAYRTHQEGSQYMHYRNAVFPEVGRPMPSFSFNEVLNYSKNKVTNEDFKGKWLILDCWTRRCDGCVRAMPYMDSMQDILGSKLQILLVGFNGHSYAYKGKGSDVSDEKEIRSIYEKVREKTHVTLPAAFDSSFFWRYDIGGTPFILVIDPQGIVRGRTFRVTLDNMRDFINGKQPPLPKNFRQHEEGSSFLIYGYTMDEALRRLE
jgi:peroxiredoxin